MKGKCNDCRTETKLEKHHVCYSPEMIIALCKKCHEKRHATGNAPRKLPEGITLLEIDLDLEQDVWVESQKRKLGFKQKQMVVRKLVRDAMLAEEKFVDEAKEAEAQENFEN